MKWHNWVIFVIAVSVLLYASNTNLFGYGKLTGR